MEMLNKDVIEATKKKFDEELDTEVRLIHFTQEPSRLILPDTLKGQECLFCKETKQLYKEVAGLSEKLELILFDYASDKDEVEEYGIDKIPAMILQGQEDYAVRFFGIPSGYEYTSLIEAVIDVSKGKTSLSPKTLEALQSIDRDIHIQVFVTPTCPYCTTAVRLAHQFAVACPHVKADMVESTEFPHLVQRYSIAGVPKTVINEAMVIEGAVPEDTFLENVLKALDPQE